MTNQGSSVSASAIVNVNEVIWSIREGEIKGYVYDETTEEWVPQTDNAQDAIVAEGTAATKGIQISLDDGTDTQFAQCDANGYLKNTLVTAIPAGSNEIGGVNQTKVAGTAVSVNSGVLDAGVQRVAIATDDVNLAAIKTAAEKIDDIQDATVAEGAVPTKGIQVMLDDGTDGQFAQCDASGYLKTTLQTAVPAGSNEIGGVNQTKVAGTAVSVGSGVLGAGVQRVAIATDDVNLSGILAQLDITQSALRDALKGAGGKDLSTLETDIEAILAATDVALSTRASEATLAAQLDITQSALRDALKGAGGKDLTTLQTALDAVETAIEAVQTSTDVALSTRASEATLAAQLDITQSALRDAIRGASTKDFTTLQTALDAVQVAAEKIDDIQDATVAEGAVPTKGIQMLLDDGTDGQFAQCDASGYLKVNLQTAVPAGSNEIGGVNQTKVAGTAVSVNSGTLGAGVQRVAIATDDVNLSAIKTAVEKIDDVQDATVAEAAAATKGIQISLDNGTTTTFAQCDANGSLKTVQRGVPVKTAATGAAAIATSYAPSAAFWLDAITIHLSAAPTTAGNLTVTLDATDGAAYDTVLFRIDPSEASDTDIVYTPDHPLLCASGDAIAVAYANADARTYGLRIMARLA